MFSFLFLLYSTDLAQSKPALLLFHTRTAPSFGSHRVSLGGKWEAGTLPSALAGEPHRPAPGPATRKGGCKGLFLLLNQGLATSKWGFPRGTSGNEPTQQCRRQKRWGLDPWVGKLPWRRVWQTSNILSWRIPRTDEPGGLQSTGTPRAGHASSDLAHRQAGGRTFFYFLFSV